MAGSYNHVVKDDGNLASNRHVTNMLENGGDVFEAVEEMYGMIWYLAVKYIDSHGTPGDDPEVQEFYDKAIKSAVEDARQNYKAGLNGSKEIHKRSPDERRS